MVHRYHIDTLARTFAAAAVRLTGGGTRSSRWCQIFADVLGRRVEVCAADETGALGAALLAGVAFGRRPDLAAATNTAVHMSAAYEPDPARTAALDALYARQQRIVVALEPVWSDLTPVPGRI